MDYVLKGLNEVTFIEETEGQDSSVLELFTDSVVGMWDIFSIVDGFFFHCLAIGKIRILRGT